MKWGCKAIIGSQAYIGSYHLVAKEMCPEHLPELHGLSASVGWPHRVADWAANLACGRGIVAVDDIGRIHGSAMCFPIGGDISSIGMVVAHPRLERSDIANWLTAEVFDRSGGKPTFLNACNDAMSVYRSLGARTMSPVFQHQGHLLRIPDFKRKCRIAEPSDLTGIFECDADAYSADRSVALSEYIKVSKIRVIERDGKIQGFAMRRKFGRGLLIGPVVALNDADAISLAGTLMSGLTGSFVRLDTRCTNGHFRRFLVGSGLIPVSSVTTMTLGELPSSRLAVIYGLSSHSTG